MSNLVVDIRRYRKLLLIIGLTILFTVVGSSVALAGNKYMIGAFSGYKSSGSAQGTLPTVTGGIPGLSGFRFNFKGGDHHFQTLTATFDAPGVLHCCSGSWRANLSDKNNDDAYWYDIRWQELPPGTIYGSGGDTIPMDGKKHGIDLGENRVFGTTPVLTGFKIAGFNGDSHLEGIELTITGETYYGHPIVPVTAEVQLSGGGSAKSVFVSYALVPSSNLITSQSWVSGTSSGGERTGTLTSAEYPVLQGFKLRFRNGSHHIDRLGVEVWPNKWRVTFEDKNHDDPYEYMILYTRLR